MLRFFLSLLNCLILTTFLLGQNLSTDSIISNARILEFSAGQDTLILDSLTVIPGSVIVKQSGSIIPRSAYSVSNNKLIFNKSQTLNPNKTRVNFRVLPYNLNAELKHKSRDLIGFKDETDILIGYNPYEQNNSSILAFKGLDYAGSFARGLSFGNNQNLVLNSNFNLQLSGDLGNDVELLAAITDSNIPLQPEGNTQQLQDFDKIFIQIKKDKTFLIAGDYELKRPQSYFVNYYKKLQGATFGSSVRLRKNAKVTVNGSVAISRGKFARNDFPGQEGNQGPYRLSGTDGERFIIILGGTERVFIDGQLLIRGFDKDYIIDYNQGEIQFTTNRLITKDSRIVVEFEYSDLNYVRTLYAANTEYKKDKFRAHFHLYSEQDAKNQPAQDNGLSTEDKIQLSLAGDDLSQAFSSGFDTLEGGFNPDRIMYKLVDTLVNSTLYPDILMYSTNADSAVFVARFTEVGENKGNYIFQTTAANGRVYSWVAPDPVSGLPSGNFEPIVRLVSPKINQIYSAGASYQLNKNSFLSTEVALSNQDLNTFSEVDNNDNQGWAGKMNYEQQINLGKSDSLTGVSLKWLSSVEYRNLNFQPIEPYRRREFGRDWNIDPSLASNELIGAAGLELGLNKHGRVGYNINTLQKDNLYQGWKHLFSANLSWQGFQFISNSSFLESQSDVDKSKFFRPNADVSKSFKKLGNLRIGAYWEQEKNDRLDVLSDTLTANSFYYNLYKAYILFPKTDKGFQTGVTYKRRQDFIPLRKNFKASTVADEVNINGTIPQKSTGRLNWNLSYRNLRILEEELVDIDPKETYLGRLEYRLNIKKGLIRSNTIYELGAGQQQKIDFNYIRVNQGEGIYAWIDRNGDEVPQLNEFETAVFTDNANFIRVSTFTNQFLKTNNVSFAQSLNINPRILWQKSPTKLQQFIRKLSSQTTLRIDRKTLEGAEVLAFNPFDLNVEDTSLLTIASSIRNTLYWNRSNPKFGVEVGQIDNRSKNVLTTGFESRDKQEWFAKIRNQIGKKWLFEVAGALGSTSNDSESFNDRDYDLNYYSVEPKLTFQYEGFFRSILTYQYQVKSNSIGNQERAVSQNGTLETTYSKLSKSNIRTKLSAVLVDFSGDAGSPIGFTMLEGLQNGQNYIWNATFERTLAKNIQLSISYEGRKTGMAKVIHLGRAQIRATF